MRTRARHPCGGRPHQRDPCACRSRSRRPSGAHTSTWGLSTTCSWSRHSLLLLPAHGIGLLRRFRHRCVCLVVRGCIRRLGQQCTCSRPLWVPHFLVPSRTCRWMLFWQCVQPGRLTVGVPLSVTSSRARSQSRSCSPVSTSCPSRCRSCSRGRRPPSEASSREK